MKKIGKKEKRTVTERKKYEVINVRAIRRVDDVITEKEILKDPEMFIDDLANTWRTEWLGKYFAEKESRFMNVEAVANFDLRLRNLLLNPDCEGEFEVKEAEVTGISVFESVEEAENELKQKLEKGFATDGEIHTNKFGNVILSSRQIRFTIIGRVWTGEWERE